MGRGVTVRFWVMWVVLLLSATMLGFYVYLRILFAETPPGNWGRMVFDISYTELEPDHQKILERHVPAARAFFFSADRGVIVGRANKRCFWWRCETVAIYHRDSEIQIDYLMSKGIVYSTDLFATCLNSYQMFICYHNFDQRNVYKSIAMGRQ